MVRFCFVIGTRPEIIKCSPLFRLMAEKKFSFSIIFTNQHSDPVMSRDFFHEVAAELPENAIIYTKKLTNLNASIDEISHILKDAAPDFVLVQGDTNSALAGAQAAEDSGIKLAHIESGLRCWNNDIIEERNRIRIDNMSDYLFAPTELEKNNLIQQGVKKNICVSGNTIVDALNLFKGQIDSSFNLAFPKLSEKKYTLLTLHRSELIDDITEIGELLANLNLFIQRTNEYLVFPIHPRTAAKLKSFGLSLPEQIKILPPMSYFNFVSLLKHSRAVITDSGGVQEEACILKVPCVTLRNETERPQTISLGANILAGRTGRALEDSYTHIVASAMDYQQPFGSGNASEIILKTLTRNSGRRVK